jgi:hypothetical protein
LELGLGLWVGAGVDLIGGTAAILESNTKSVRFPLSVFRFPLVRSSTEILYYCFPFSFPRWLHWHPGPLCKGTAFLDDLPKEECWHNLVRLLLSRSNPCLVLWLSCPCRLSSLVAVVSYLVAVWSCGCLVLLLSCLVVV